VKERILIHLIEYAKYVDELEVPSAITQEGIARETGIDVPHFTQYVRPLIQEGLIRERMAHVKGVRRRRKVYDLTDTGKLSAVRLRDKLKSEVLRVRDQKEVREASVSQILKEVSRKVSLLDVLRQAMETGIVDLASLAGVPLPSFVEMLSDAPQLKTFVGRRAELEAITGESEQPRVFVVRGVAGIGKSSFGAKATELLRGKRNLFWHQVRRWDTHLSILASLGDFLAALGRPGLRSVLTRDTMDRAVQVLREDMPGTQSFLVMDDAHEASPDAVASLRLLKEIIADAPDVRLLVLTRETLPFYDRRDVVVRGLVREMELGGLVPEEVEALLSPKLYRATSDVVRQLGGHPLFLELVRASPDALPAQALRDVRRFVEEEIYRKLSDRERRMMKVAALYRVAVPHEALVPDETLTEDVLLSLTERSLIRPVGEDGYEVHEAVRDVFAAMSTPAERQALVEFAVSQLRGLAAESWDRENFVACARYLANALQMPVSSAVRLALLGAVGDAMERMGDVDAAAAAYREAMELTETPEVLARLHRKIADPLATRGELANATLEIEAGFLALGDTPSAERGWLHLARGRVAIRNNQLGEAQEDGEVAFRIFQQVGDVSGQADACAELGWITGHSGATDSQGSPLVEQYYKEALRLVESLADARLAGRLHVLAAERAYYHAWGVDRFRQHLDAAEALVRRARDPILSRQLLIMRATLKFYSSADFDGAMADAAEAFSLAKQVRDSEGKSLAKYWLAQCSRAMGAIAEARRGFEEVAKELGASGVRYYGSFATGYAAECFLMEGDANGYRRFVADRGEGVREFHLWTAVLEGFNLLIEGRDAESASRFREAIRFAEGQPAKATLFKLDLGLVHFYYAAALRALGRQREAVGEMDRALEAWRAYNNQGFLVTAASRAERLVDGLREILAKR